MKNNTSEERLQELQRAKNSMKAWTRQGRNWDYNVMCRRYPDRKLRLALVEDLRSRGFFIANAPKEEDTVHEGELSNPESPALVSSTTEGFGSSAEESLSCSDSSYGNDAAQRDPSRQKAAFGVRTNMQKMGLYEKFPLDTPILLEFDQYLVDHLNSSHCHQQVENVSRMLRYIQPTGDDISMDFLGKSTKTKDYIVDLKRAQLLPATIINYIKSMIQFVEFLKTRQVDDQDFRRSCDSYRSLLQSLRKPVTKANGKITRCEPFVEGQKSLAECQRVLLDSNKDMLGILRNLQEDKQVSAEEKTLFRYYCEAVLLLGHVQRPTVAEKMTITEWLNKKLINGRVCVGVDPKLATFALTIKESAMLDAYYLHIRPDYLREDVDDNGRFFISATGPIRSATGDLCRLQAHYKLPNITNQEMRRVVEAEVSKHCLAEQQAHVAHYMGNSTALAEHMKTHQAAVTAANTLSSLAGFSDGSGDDRSGRAQKRGRETDEEASGEKRDFAEFVDLFPVTLSGQPPTKKQRASTGFPTDRAFYDKWRALQYGKREEYLLAKRYRRPPTVKKVAEIIGKEGWTANHPRPEDIVANWKPSKKIHIETDQDIMKRITTQKWSGLAVRDFGEKRGQGVVATKMFSKGSVICDYHGMLITAEEGRQMQESRGIEMGHLYFFSSGGRKLCIDAHTFPCECHPDGDTTGRKMKRSGKNPNVQPIHCRMLFPEGEKDTVLLVAAKDIVVNEELCFDYKDS
ncbi:hypothetical protein Q5P01_003092 [Channa striata]|uniref:SET domain-containing protein n=1 Tax=Channa striata TaxID=64152 RepID=A0AA88NVF4_CHASR|nr:hypothetical protein Q5P01_003092 [Channa striata]